MDISTTIKLLRKEKKLSQKGLAEKIGKSERAVQKYESGEISPPIAVLEEIAKTLNVDMDAFFTSYEFGHEYDGVPFGLMGEVVVPLYPIKEVDTYISSRDDLPRLAYDIRYILQYQKKAYYNGHLLDEQERQRALDMLKLLFPEYTKEGVDVGRLG